MSNRYVIVEDESGVPPCQSYITAEEAKEACPQYDHRVAELVPAGNLQELDHQNQVLQARLRDESSTTSANLPGEKVSKNRYVVLVSKVPASGESHETADLARKEGDAAGYASYSVAELVPVLEIEELRASAAGEKFLADQLGELAGTKTDDGLRDRIKVLETLLEEHKRQIEDYAVELRISDAKRETLEKELYRADKQLARFSGVRDPAPDIDPPMEEADTKRLREQRLWEAYLSLQGQDFDSDGMQMLAAESHVEFFEERHPNRLRKLL